MYNYFNVVQEENNITPDTLTLDFVKQYLRVEHDLDDIEIRVAMKSAVAYVRKYIKQPDEEPLDYELIIPILTLISHFYESKTPIGKSSEKVDALINSILELNRADIL